MDSHDQRKLSPSGHENHGVHVCHRCGWPFPNPHPSAKHRRAHKRICGTIEGYKLTDLEEHTHLAVSDDEHLSDEDCQTPSPKIEKRSVDETGSGAVGEKLTRSEDEVFSDAKAEFSDSGFNPGTGHRLEFAKELDKRVQKIVEGDSNSGQPLKADPTVDSTEPLKRMANNSDIHSSEVLESASNRQESITLFQDARSKEGSFGPNSMNSSPSELALSKSEIPISETKQDINTKVGDNEIQNLVMHPKGVPEVKRNSEHYGDEVLTVVAKPVIEIANKSFDGQSELEKTDGRTSDPLIAESKLYKTDGMLSDPVTEDGIAELKHEQSDGSQVKIAKHNIATEVRPVEDMEAGVGNVLIEADSAQDIMCDGHDKLVEACGMKVGGKEDMHVLCVDNILPTDDHPETLMEDFMDHRLSKSNIPLNLGSGEESRSLVEKNMDTEHDIATEVKPVEDMEAGICSVLIDADSAQDITDDGDDKLVEACDMKVDGKEDVHVLCVDNILSVADHPETLIEDFKDHRLLKSNLPLNLGSCQEIKSLAEKNMDTINEESSSNLCSIRPGGITYSSADTDVLEHNVKDEGIGLVVQEEVGISQLMITSSKDVGSNGLEGSSSPSRCKTLEFQTHHCIEGLQPHFHTNESSTVTVSDHSGMDLSDVIPVATSVDDKISLLTRTEHVEIEDHDLDKTENFDRAKNEGIEGVAEGKVSSCHTRAALISLEKFSVSDVDQVADLAGGYDGGHNETRVKLSDIPENDGMGEVAAEKECPMNTETVVKSAGQFLGQTCPDRAPDPTRMDIDESGLGNLGNKSVIPVNMVAESNSKSNIELSEKSLARPIVEELGHMLVDSEFATKSSATSEDTRNVENGMAGNFFTAVGMGAESKNNGSVEVGEGSLENPIVEVSGPLPVDSEFAIKNSATVGYNHGKESGRADVDHSSESPLQEEGNDKHTKQQFGTSVMDMSIDSGSQTDSLEGNWGSVSVLSIQSDAMAVPDSEGVPLIGSLAPEESASISSQKLETMPVGRDPDKGDVFEPPSFMTLVVPGCGVDQKAGAQTVQNTHRSELGSPQGGWFPSISNVVNQSPGRKKNEEIIAKVTNWSTGKQHAPLKNPLGDTKAETKLKSTNTKQTPTLVVKDENAAKNSSPSMTTVSSILKSEAPSNQSAKRDAAKEWNSPARHPADTKKDKKKVKGKSNWVPFICCSSVQEPS